MFVELPSHVDHVDPVFINPSVSIGAGVPLQKWSDVPRNPGTAQ